MLEGLSVLFVKDGAQALVALHERAEGLLQRGRVQGPVQAQGLGHVVGGAGAEAVEEPHALLGE